MTQTQFSKANYLHLA